MLVPIEKPNISSSIDTLDEQKTDKKPNEKKKKKKKKEEEQDHPADVQDNNILTHNVLASTPRHEQDVCLLIKRLPVNI